MAARAAFNDDAVSFPAVAQLFTAVPAPIHPCTGWPIWSDLDLGGYTCMWEATVATLSQCRMLEHHGSTKPNYLSRWTTLHRGMASECGHLWMEHRETRSAKISGRSKGSAGFSPPKFAQEGNYERGELGGGREGRRRRRPELICGVSHMSRKIDKGRR